MIANKYVLTPLLLISTTACDLEVDNTLPGVPATGFFAAVQANQHAGEDDIQAAAAVFSDGEPINLVGGDLFEASTSAESALLLKRGFYEGTYVTDLPNPTNLDDVTMRIVHDNEAATEHRWYPIELFNIDPGPGELVGGAASMTLPPAPAISAPAENTIYTDVSDTFDLMWTPAGAGDTVAVRSVVTCGVVENSETYGTTATLADNSDDGTETIALSEFILDFTDGNDIAKLVLDEARILLLELLNRLSAGAINEDNFELFFPVNPVNSNCEVQVFLFRERPGSVASPVNSRITGSRSDDVTILYQPPIAN